MKRKSWAFLEEHINERGKWLCVGHSLMVHQAARRLKTRDTVGEPMIGLGRAILAGCKRSTDLARLYLSDMLGGRSGEEGGGRREGRRRSNAF